MSDDEILLNTDFAKNEKTHKMKAQRLTPLQIKRLKSVDALFGSVPDTMTLEEAKAERLKEI